MEEDGVTKGLRDGETKGLREKVGSIKYEVGKY